MHKLSTRVIALLATAVVLLLPSPHLATGKEAVEAADATVLELDLQLDGEIRTLRFTPLDDLVQAAERFEKEELGGVQGSGCLHEAEAAMYGREPHCMSTRIVREMVKMLVRENRLDRQRHQRALVYSQIVLVEAGPEDRVGDFSEIGEDSMAATAEAQRQIGSLTSARYDIEAVDLAGRLADTEKVTHHGYDRTYWRFLPPPTESSSAEGIVSILEIGRSLGASMRMWRLLYPTGNLVGLDAEGGEEKKVEVAEVGEEADGRPKIVTTMLRGDASDPDALGRCARAAPEGYDAIVDGGSKWSSVPALQLAAFRHLFPSLKPGGVYIVEGVESSYWGAGSRLLDATTDGTSLVEVFKAHLDNLNSEFSGRQAAAAESFGFDHEIEMVAFAHNCIAVTRGRRQDVDYFSWRRYRWDDTNGEDPNYAIAAPTALPRELVFSFSSSSSDRSSPMVVQRGNGNHHPNNNPPVIVFARRYTRFFQFFNALRHEATRNLDRGFVRVFDARALDAALSACGGSAVVVAFPGTSAHWPSRRVGYEPGSEYEESHEEEWRYFSRAVAPVLRKHSSPASSAANANNNNGGAGGCSLVVYETEPLEIATEADNSTADRVARLRDRYAVWGMPSPTVWVYSHRVRRELTDLGLDRLGLRAVTYLPPGYSTAYDYRQHPQRSERTRCSPVGVFSAGKVKDRLGGGGGGSGGGGGGDDDSDGGDDSGSDGDALPEAVLVSNAWSDADWAASVGSHHSAVNLHRTERVRSLEAFRLAPLLASGLLVVSERADPSDEHAFEGLVHFAPRRQVTARLRELGRPVCPTATGAADEAAQRAFAARVSDDFRRRFNLTEGLLEALRDVERGRTGTGSAGG